MSSKPHVADRTKACLITGATSGIGRAAALQLGCLDMHIILVGRNHQQGASIADKIIKKCGQGKAAFLRADIASLADVRTLAQKVKQDYACIDVLINNAGARFNQYQTSPDGIELTFATNHLGHFLLTHLLADQLKASPAARVINVSSDAHCGYSADFSYLLQKDSYDRKAAYGKSKLANLLFTYELSRRAVPFNITANALHPGGVATNLGRNNGLISWAKHYIYYLGKRQLVSPNTAASTIVYLAISDPLIKVTGKYFYKKNIIDSSAASHDLQAAKELWDLSIKLCGSTDMYS